MAGNGEDPIEACALRQEKLSCHESGDADRESILRVISRKSVRRGDEVQWTEEVKNLVSPRKSVNSSDTIVAGEGEDRGFIP